MIPTAAVARPQPAPARLVSSAPKIVLDRLSRLPFQLRRRGLRLFFSRLGRPLLGRPGATMVRGCARTLALSPRASEAFLYRKLLHDALFLMEWQALANRSRAGLIADARYIATDAHDDLSWIAAQPGAIVGTLHFGPYSLALVWLLHTYFQGRKVIIVKSTTDDETEQRAITRLGELGVDIEFIPPDQPAHFHQLIKKVRAGAIAVIMIDLPPAYGRSDPVDLLGHRVQIASGTVDLAALCGVPLMLFRICSRVTRDRFEVGDIFEVARGDPDTRARAVARVNRFLTRTLVDNPDHWHMWARLGEYAVPAAREDAA